MYFLFSGEGATDLGSGTSQNLSEGNDYLYGPMTLLVDQVVENIDGYSIISYSRCGFVSKKRLVDYYKEKKPLKVFSLPRREMKESQGTKYFENNARALAEIAKEIAQEKDDVVVAILFRDSDRRHSSESGEWEKKRKSMLNGFKAQKFDRGVAMIPQPCSEAWLLCALYRKDDTNRNCNHLELRTHGPKSSHSLKIELEEQLGEQPNPLTLNRMIADKKIHYCYISLNSFQQFLENLKSAIR